VQARAVRKDARTGSIWAGCGHAARSASAALVVCAVAALALVATPALADRGHVFDHAFDGKTPGSGQFEKLEDPAGVAVDEATGEVYVVDVGKERVERFNSTGSTFEGSFNGATTPAKTFLGAEGIAVDNGCAEHEQITGEALGRAACEALDPSDGDVYVVDAGHAVVDKFNAAGEYMSQLTGGCERVEESPPCSSSRFIPFAGVDGVAVDTAGRLWVAASGAGGGEGWIFSFSDSPANLFLRTVVTRSEPGARQRPGFAVDAEDDSYDTFEYPLEGESFLAELGSDGTVSSAWVDGEPLHERLAGSPPPGVAVELTGAHDVYVDNTTTIAQLTHAGVLVERFGEGHLSSAGGVAVDARDGDVYAVDSVAGVVAQFTPEPPGAPRIENESAAEVSSTGASLRAEVDPDGASTSYRFEYGRCVALGSCAGTGYEGSAPAASVGSDFEFHELALTVGGLQPDSVYHYRVVAENEVGEGAHVEGEHTFVTQPAAAGGPVLPDGREWELVSPPDRHGALISATGMIQAAIAGGGISYPASASTEAEPHGFTGAVQVLSTRGPEGWSSRDVTVPHAGASGRGAEYRFSSADLSRGVVQPSGPFVACEPTEGVRQICLSPEASEQTAYLRENASGLYTPLVSAANVPPGTVFGGEVAGECAEPGQVACGPKFRGATSDLDHIVLSSPVALTAGAPSGEGLYEWSAGKLQSLGAVTKAPRLAFHAISDDGSRVVFDGSSEGHEGLLLRDTIANTTVQLDAPGCTVGCAAGGGEFQAAAGDGSKVFFTDARDLTSGAGGTVNGRGEPEADLYVCEVPLAATPACDLHDLTPLAAGGEHAGVVGVLGASEDGSYVYFVANGILTGEADSAGEHAVQGSCLPAAASRRPGQCNLYALHDTAGGWEAPRLIAVLAAADHPDWSPGLEGHTARVSPDGGWLAFMSQRSLTGYDNEDATSVEPGERLDEEVYLYRAGASVVCASCDPTGMRPAGVQYSQIESAHGGLAGGDSVWPASAWIAASVPGWTSYEPGAALYQPRYLSNGGRLFFDSSDALVPQDSNGEEDVYEYEPAGHVGAEGASDCGPANDTFSERADGCIALISSATSSEESVFLDASEDGGDVFFLTSASLVAQDTNASADVYDAHECTSGPCTAGPVADQSPACASEASCRPVPAAHPTVEPPVSATFSAAGSPTSGPAGIAVLGERRKAKPETRAQELAAALARCRKDRSKATRANCERSARGKYGAKAHKSEATRREGGRP
jgi:DNA-binding beta-propeller fold protein YncE